MSLIGLDIGTTGCKAIIFDEDGHILSRAAREYSILTPHAHWAEQDAERVWTLAWQALGEAVSKNRGGPPKAMALSAQGEAVVPVDRDGRALRNVILGMDTRTGEENRWLADHIGAETLFSRTGMPVHTINTLPKLLWLRRNEPDTWNKARRFLLYEDFFLRRLGGQAAISHCLASRTQMYDLATGDWASDILETSGIDPDRLAPLAKACAALGSGVTRDGLAMVSTGTAEVVEVAMSSPALSDALTFELRVNLDLLRRSGIAIHELRAVGGGARSPLWLQLKADICGVPLRVADVTEAACLGAALLAGAARGVYPDLATAVTRAVRLGRRIVPDPHGSAAYDKRFQLYQKVYPTLKNLHDRLHA